MSRRRLESLARARRCPAGTLDSLNDLYDGAEPPRARTKRRWRLSSETAQCAKRNARGDGIQ
jgi:hypothetical protein